MNPNLANDRVSHVTDKFALRLSMVSACSGVRTKIPMSCKAALGSVSLMLGSLLGSCSAEYSASFSRMADPVFSVSRVHASFTL